MAQTFDIRFGRGAGFMSLFDAPANSFGWKGSGLLSIDAHGISVALKHGVAWLLARPRSQRIAAENIREVYREGEALRVEFATRDNPRVVIPFWAEDRETAAEIVKLLPTTRTVEIEHNATGATRSRLRIPWRLSIGLVSVAALVWAGTSLVGADRAVEPFEPVLPPLAVETPAFDVDAAPPAARADDELLAPVPVELVPPSLPGDARTALTAPTKLAPESAIYGPALERAARFVAKATVAETVSRTYHELFTTRQITTDEFLEKLDDLEMQWWDVTFQLLDDDVMADPALVDLRATMLAAARHWRNFYRGYADGLRGGDHVMIAASFDELTRAEEQRVRIRPFFR